VPGPAHVPGPPVIHSLVQRAIVVSAPGSS